MLLIALRRGFLKGYLWIREVQSQWFVGSTCYPRDSCWTSGYHGTRCRYRASRSFPEKQYPNSTEHNWHRQFISLDSNGLTSNHKYSNCYVNRLDFPASIFANFVRMNFEERLSSTGRLQFYFEIKDSNILVYFFICFVICLPANEAYFLGPVS